MLEARMEVIAIEPKLVRDVTDHLQLSKEEKHVLLKRMRDAIETQILKDISDMLMGGGSVTAWQTQANQNNATAGGVVLPCA